MKDVIGQSLGLDPMEGELMNSSSKNVIKAPSNSEKDYEYARENFYHIIESGNDALDQMLEVARASEHPRAYEVVSTLMRTLVDANKDLVTMNEKTNKNENKNVTNNNLFVGSTAELQQLLKNANSDE